MRAIALLTSLFVLGLAPAASAQEPDAPESSFVVSGAVNVERGETLEEVVVVDGPVTIDGEVTGDVVAIAGPITVSGTVGGDVVAISDRATIEDGARVAGDVAYGDEEPQVAPGADVAGDVRKVNAGGVDSPFSGFVAGLAIWLAISVSSLLLGLLLIWLAPRAIDATFETARTRIGPSIGLGIALFIGLPLLVLIALITIVGIPLALTLLAALVPIYAIAYTIAAWLLGRTILGPPRGRVLSFFVGWGILRLLALVPFLGGLAWFAATVFGLGVLLVAIWHARRPPSAVATTTAPA